MVMRSLYLGLMVIASCRAPAEPLPEPQKPWREFTASLRDNNLEKALQHFSPHVRDTYRGILAQKNLPELAQQLPPLPEKPAYSRGKFVQYELTVNNEEYAVVMHCYGERCEIVQF